MLMGVAGDRRTGSVIRPPRLELDGQFALWTVRGGRDFPRDWNTGIHSEGDRQEFDC